MNHMQPQKQMQQLHGMPPNSNSASSWYRSALNPEMICQSFASNASTMPDRYMMVGSGGGGMSNAVGGRTMAGYYGATVQKMPANLVAGDYGQPNLEQGPHNQNFVGNGMMPKMMGQNAANMNMANMMLESSGSLQHVMMAAGNRSQVMNPDSEIYQDHRMSGVGRPMYAQQFGPGQRGQGLAMDGVRMPAAGTDLGPDVMYCRMSGGEMSARSATSYSSQQQRVMPYPNPQQYMQNKRAQYRARCTKMYDFDPTAGMQTYGVDCYGSGWPRQPAPSQQPVPSHVYQCVEMPNHHIKEEPVSYVQMGNPNQCQPALWNMPQRPNRELVQMNTFSPPPGNPTPPMTPGSSQPCHATPPDMSDVRPGGPRLSRDSEQCFTFPVRDGTIMMPFQLEHNLSVTCHNFNLQDQVHESLMMRHDLELMLKCFHKDDRSLTTNWPVTVSINLNNVPLPIDRGSVHHQPMLLKSICKPGQNSLQISVKTCCCSHLFVLQIVQRPTVQAVLQGLLTKRLYPAAHAITKIKRLMSQMLMTYGGGSANDAQSVPLSLSCPISSQRIVLPARGRDCRHIQCFDLESYLKMNCDRNLWICPICKKAAHLDGLEVDQYFWGILVHLSSFSSDRVILDVSANWRPMPRNGMEFSNDVSQTKKFISVDSMVLPNLNTYSLSKASITYGPQAALSGGGGGPSTHDSLYERNQKPAANELPNYLGCLSQMADGFLAADNSPGATLMPGNGMEHVSFPPTPMGSQISQICTPLDGQSLHPRTPSDGNATNPHTPPDVGGHPYTPLDSNQPIKTEKLAPTPSAAAYDGFNGRRGTGLMVSEAGGSAMTLFTGNEQLDGLQTQFTHSQDQSAQMNRDQSARMGSPLISDLTSLDFKSNFSLENLPEIDDDRPDMLNLLDGFDDDPSELSSYLGPENKQQAKSISLAASKENDEFLSFLT